MKLYMHPASTTSRPVMMFAKLAGLSLEMQVIDLMKGEHHGPAYVKINPNRLVPTLDDDGFVLTESSAILKYLAEKAKSPLYPTDARQRARVNERMDWFNTNLYRDYGYNLVYPQIFPHHARPSEDITKGAIDWGSKKSAGSLQILDEHILGSNAYVCGESMTIADIFGAQILSCGELVRVDFGKYPNVKRWYGAMKALPAWTEINDAHEGFVKMLADKPMTAL